MVPMQKNNKLSKNLPYACFTILFILIGLTTLASSMNLLILRLASINAEEQVKEKLEQAEALRQAVHLEGDVINPNGRIDFLTPQEKPEQEENISVCSCACLDYHINRKRKFLFFKKSNAKQKNQSSMSDSISMDNIDVVDENINKIPTFKPNRHKYINKSNSSRFFLFFKRNNTKTSKSTPESTSNNTKHKVKRLNPTNRNDSKNNKFDAIELVDCEPNEYNILNMNTMNSCSSNKDDEDIVYLTRSNSGLTLKINNIEHHHLDEITTVETNTSKRNSI
jgi:hypothetical protein